MDIVEAYPETALAVSLDVCSQDSIKNAVKEAYDKFGTIDVLVNNAGYGYRSAVEEGEIEAVQTLYQTNLFGPIELIKAVLPKMREQKIRLYSKCNFDCSSKICCRFRILCFK